MAIELTPDKIRQIAQAYGHTGVSIVPQPNGTWWNVICDCGYRSTRRRTSAEAADAAFHHLMVIARKYAASGLTLPTTSDSPEAGVVFRERNVAS